jgi:hypothetical protein
LKLCAHCEVTPRARPMPNAIITSLRKNPF